jgi:hypothetical protein
MNFSPELERQLRQSVRQGRMVAVTCCFVAPAMYAISLVSQALRGRWGALLDGFGRLPWDEPRVRLLLAAAGLAMILALGVVPRLGRLPDAGSALGVLRARNLLRSALLAGVAVCGLVLGIRIGPPAASLSLVLFLGAAAGGAAVFPSERHWREVMTLAAKVGPRSVAVRED